MAFDAPADSSPASTPDAPLDTAPISDRLASLSEPDLLAWRETGALPKTLATADPPPAVPAVQAASTDASDPPAASEPATRTPKNAETRKAELQAEIKAALDQKKAIADEIATLQAQATSLRRPVDAPAAPSPAPTPKTLAETIQHPDPTAALMGDTDFFVAFPEATYGDYARYAARHEVATVRLDEQRSQASAAARTAIDARWKTYGERMSAAAAADPAFTSKLSDEVKALKPTFELTADEPMTALHVLADEILDSAIPDQVARYFSEHPDELRRFSALTSQRAVTREFARVEERLAPGTKAPEPVKVVTSASAPPPTLGGKTTDAVDPIEAARKRGDTAEYIRLANERDLKAARA